MRRVDFSKISLEMIDGNHITVDFQHGENGLANQLYMQAREIKWKDLGKRIYYADGEIELNDEECTYILNHVKSWPVVSQEGIIHALEQ